MRPGTRAARTAIAFARDGLCPVDHLVACTELGIMVGILEDLVLCQLYVTLCPKNCGKPFSIHVGLVSEISHCGDLSLLMCILD